MTKKQNDQKPEEALGQQALEVRWLLHPVSFIGTGHGCAAPPNLQEAEEGKMKKRRRKRHWGAK
jgi:hypothetical protein